MLDWRLVSWWVMAGMVFTFSDENKSLKRRLGL
jgi:hypothetical protein